MPSGPAAKEFLYDFIAKRMSLSPKVSQETERKLDEHSLMGSAGIRFAGKRRLQGLLMKIPINLEFEVATFLVLIVGSGVLYYLV